VNPSRILILGSGGREHALAWRLARDAHAPRIWVTPGTDGMQPDFGRLTVRETDVAGLLGAVREHAIELVVVGPEAPLAAGVSDALVEAGVPVFGASREAARLESSKWFAKQVMREAGVPTARAEAFVDPAAAVAALDRFGPPWVVKADGLAAGKGVLVSSDRSEAERFIQECLEGVRFGSGGERVVIEQHLTGEEVSVMAVCDGERWVLLPPARDHKRALDGDRGPNTGGMGAYCPVAGLAPAWEREVGEQVVAPVLRVMASRGTPYRGALYCGLMLTPAGTRVIEFNARFGDPETQAIVPLVTGSFSHLLASAAAGALQGDAVGRAAGAVVVVAIVAEGYPGEVRSEGRIEGLDALAGRGCLVFHAGTERDGSGFRIRGGRAAYVAAVEPTAERARDQVYEAVATLSGPGWRVRADIARRAISVLEDFS
jgi:phosphoribosylamine--glycine ligase